MHHELPPLREVIAAESLTARRSLGQNFILDMNINNKIAGMAGDLRQASVLEIGPGPGGLTRALLDAGASRVHAVEIDDRFRNALGTLESHYPGRLEITYGDGLKLETPYGLPTPYNIIANLPYNVATRFLVEWLTCRNWPPDWKCIVVTLQNEVADRIAAGPGSKSYGRISALAQLRSEVRLMARLPARAFTPMPKVSSAVVRIVPGTSPLEDHHIHVFEQVVKAAFNQRRKMLRASLRHMFIDSSEELAYLSIDPAARADQVSIDDYCRMVRYLDRERGGPG